MIVDFYHLSATPIERVLPRICERIVSDGERLLIVAGEDQLARLDAQLWSYARDAFLPHGRSDRPGAEAQPILLSAKLGAVNGAVNIALADGIWRDEALAFARAFFFFDTDGLDAARGAWRGFKANEATQRRYWKQDDKGKWVEGP